MQIRALLFDFDGTLADSFGAITSSTNFVRSQFQMPPVTEAQVREYVGHGLAHLLERLVPGVNPAAAVSLYREHHPQVMFSGTRLFPGVTETLKTLHSQGRKLAVCSNKSVWFTKKLVEGFGLSEYLPIVLGPEDVPAPKPDPVMLFEALKRLEILPAEAVYVGDMAIDVQTARSAGLPVWIMPGGAQGVESTERAEPDRTLRDFAEILELVG